MLSARKIGPFGSNSENVFTKKNI